jgi:hypothetical protein
MTARVLFALALVTFVASAAGACKAVEPTNRPIDGCVKKCTQHASRQCSEGECERGCEMILDRIVEREGNHVIACVARQARRCADVVWAECAANVGSHADGGPPGPPPPAEDWE